MKSMPAPYSIPPPLYTQPSELYILFVSYTSVRDSRDSFKTEK